MIHTAVISLGSNLPCSADMLADAASRLATVCRVVRSSGVYYGPDDTGRGPQYANAVIEIATSLSPDGFREFARGLEAAAGRTPESKSLGLMPLDIDTVIWDGEVVDPYDRRRPYFIKGYTIIESIRP